MTEQEGRRPRLHVIGGAAADGSDDAAMGEAVRSLAGSELQRIDHEALLALSLGDAAADDAVLAQERLEADRLRDALRAGQGHPLLVLCESLRAVWTASDGCGLAPEDHEALLRMTLGDDVAQEMDEAEAREVGIVADALAGSKDRRAKHPVAELSEHPLAKLSVSLRLAHASAELDALSHERVLRRALRSTAAERRSAMPIVGAVLAVAATVALFVTSLSDRNRQSSGPAPDAQATIAPRSTQALFDPSKPFPRKGGESERLAKIVSARAADLRANRFAQWGVR
jgi:hypothetical protein